MNQLLLLELNIPNKDLRLSGHQGVEFFLLTVIKDDVVEFLKGHAHPSHHIRSHLHVFGPGITGKHIPLVGVIAHQQGIDHPAALIDIDHDNTLPPLLDGRQEKIIHIRFILVNHLKSLLRRAHQKIYQGLLVFKMKLPDNPLAGGGIDAVRPLSLELRYAQPADACQLTCLLIKIDESFDKDKNIFPDEMTPMDVKGKRRDSLFPEGQAHGGLRSTQAKEPLVIPPEQIKLNQLSQIPCQKIKRQAALAQNTFLLPLHYLGDNECHRVRRILLGKNSPQPLFRIHRNHRLSLNNIFGRGCLLPGCLLLPAGQGRLLID